MNSAIPQQHRSEPAYQKWIKKGLFPVFILFVLYHSVYFKRLSSMEPTTINNIDFHQLADSLYYKSMMQTSYDLDAQQLVSDFESHPDSIMSRFGNRLGIGQSAYFMVTVEGLVIEKTTDGLLLKSNDQIYTIDSKYIFGNAIRDASGLVKLTDFKTNAAFNQLSEALNTLIRETVIPKHLQEIKSGDSLRVTGAIKLSKQAKEDLRILPVMIEKGTE